MTLSDYLRGELEQIAAQLTYDELRNRLGELPAAKVAESPADAVRAERDSR
jgi:antitoxin FitA